MLLRHSERDLGALAQELVDQLEAGHLEGGLLELQVEALLALARSIPLHGPTTQLVVRSE